MTLFLLIACLLVAASLAYVLWPLAKRPRREAVSRDEANLAVYRDQLRELEADLRAGAIAADHYDKAREEIERRLLEETAAGPEDTTVTTPPARRAPLAAAAFGVAIPLCAVLVYLAVGTPGALAPAPARQQATGGSHDITPEQISAMVEKLAARLKQNPEDGDGWLMLAKTYGALGRFSDASTAFAEAARRRPDDAQLLADYADVLAMAQGRSLFGEPERLIARALKADANNVKALALAGTVAFEKKDYEGAIRHWERIVAIAPPDSPFANSVRGSIAEARSLAARAPAPPADKPLAAAAAPPADEPKATPPRAAAAGAVSGVARLSPELAAKVAPGDTVFIFARAAEGPRAPLAILRKQASELPVKFVLDDSMSMNPQLKLSAFPSVIVSARVSKVADATPRPGDLQGQSAPVRIGARSVELVIDSVVP